MFLPIRAFSASLTLSQSDVQNAPMVAFCEFTVQTCSITFHTKKAPQGGFFSCEMVAGVRFEL
ncbi:MAG TPA: hypothetical protein DD400_03860, partial [Rhodospirillaceae bacterium]|nr:hypothetical protein [Rhodospirillaceae bacterium]